MFFPKQRKYTFRTIAKTDFCDRNLIFFKHVFFRSENESSEREIPEITLEEEFKSGSEGYKSGSGKKSSETNEDNKVVDGDEVKNREGEDVTVLPSDYQFLFNRFSYSNLLTQGHLYFRSWDELQYQVLGSVPEHSNSALAGGPPGLVHHPFDRSGSYNSDDERYNQFLSRYLGCRWGTISKDHMSMLRAIFDYVQNFRSIVVSQFFDDFFLRFPFFLLCFISRPGTALSEIICFCVRLKLIEKRLF